MFARIAILILVLTAVALLLPLALSAVKRGKERYEEMGADEEHGREDGYECDHLYYPSYDRDGELLGQECKLCHRFNSLKDLGLAKENTSEK